MAYGGNFGTKVISASRRVDMVGCYPDDLVRILETKSPPDTVHSLVLWTKNANNLFAHAKLSQIVKTYTQIYLHYTVTGMGGTTLEPAVPSTEVAMAMLPRLVALLGSPRRIRFRFDPIVHFMLPDGKPYCNITVFEQLAPKIAANGITDISISWMSEYKKVVNRLSRSRIGIQPLTQEQWQLEADFMLERARENGLTIHGCCVPGLPPSRCIDGPLLNDLHPMGWICSTRKARGQRSSCGCTESWDVGWYYRCRHGCLYCYASPAMVSRNR